MKCEPIFTPLDTEHWERREAFYYFSQMAPTGYSLTVEMNVTRLRKTLKQAGLRFYPAYLWLVTRALNEQQEFKIAVRDGKTGFYETLAPLFAVFHTDDHTFSLMWMPFDDDFRAFYADYLMHMETYGENHGILAQKDALPPPNAYTVSCVPWISFQHFAVQSYDCKPYFFPSVEAGRFREQAEETFLPLSITCHHAATDGWHVHRFLEKLQNDMNVFDEALK